MSLMPITLYPDQVLTTPAQPVVAFDDELRQLAEDMHQTMVFAKGIGLAAPQVGLAMRFLIVDLSSGDRSEDLLVIANPEVVEEKGRQTGEEGCLSFPGIHETITRPSDIVVEGQDLQGKKIRVDASELFARCLHHEIDHVNGIVFLDRMSQVKRSWVKKKIHRLMKKDEWHAAVE